MKRTALCLLSGLLGLIIFSLPQAVAKDLPIKAFFGMPTEEVKDEAIEGSFVEELNYIEDHIKDLNSFPERAIWLENYFYAKLNKADDLTLAFKLNQTVIVYL